MVISSTQITESNGTASTFASDIGLKPGEWPDMIQVDYPDGAVYFHRSDEIKSGGEFGGFQYRTRGQRSTSLAVFND